MIAETQPHLQTEPVNDVRERVLIVDDDETHLEVLRHGLERQGFDVLAATRGCDLFKYIVEQKPDVVILDINLPDANGLDICQELVDAPKTTNIPVIILSGSTEKAVVRQARQAGCRFFLSKPFDPNAILLVVRQAIDEGREF